MGNRCTAGELHKAAAFAITLLNEQHQLSRVLNIFPDTWLALTLRMCAVLPAKYLLTVWCCSCRWTLRVGGACSAAWHSIRTVCLQHRQAQAAS